MKWFVAANVFVMKPCMTAMYMTVESAGLADIIGILE